MCHECDEYLYDQLAEFCSTPDLWLVTTNLRKIEGAGPSCKTSCFLDCLRNGSKTCHAGGAFFLSFASTKMSRSAHSKQLSCDSSAFIYYMHPFCYIHYNRIQVIDTYVRHYRYITRGALIVPFAYNISFVTVNDVTKPCKLDKYMYSVSEGHNTKYKLYMSDRMR